jgi:hypothetical protein
LARAPALQAGGRRFDSDILHRSQPRVAQLVKQGDIWGEGPQITRLGTVSSAIPGNREVSQETKFFDILGKKL